MLNLNLLGPHGPPLGLEVTKTSHNSLQCSWKLPAEHLCNGPITGYEVRYLKSVKKDEVSKINYKLVNKTSVSLYQLEAGSNYEVSIRAFTVIGAGPFNHPPTLIFTGKGNHKFILKALRDRLPNKIYKGVY